MNKWDEQKRQGHSKVGQQKLTEAQHRILDAIPKLKGTSMQGDTVGGRCFTATTS